MRYSYEDMDAKAEHQYMMSWRDGYYVGSRHNSIRDWMNSEAWTDPTPFIGANSIHRGSVNGLGIMTKCAGEITARGH